MATSERVQLQPQAAAESVNSKANRDVAKEVSDLLQTNHEKYHIFFNERGFHNHLSHGLLTMYAMGSTAAELKRHYASNEGYQRSLRPVSESVVTELQDTSNWHKYLGHEKHYHDWVAHFERTIAKSNWQTVFRDIFFGEPKTVSDDMRTRLFAGLYHSIITLGLGAEFNQPVIIAEGLAQTAVHKDWMKRYIPHVRAKIDHDKPNTPLVALLHSLSENQKIRASVRKEDASNIRDGVLGRAPDEMINTASQWHVDPKNLGHATAEMTNAATYLMAAAQQQGKVPKMDFFLMHTVTCSIFFTTFLHADWLDDTQKAILLEDKAWTDLAVYAGSCCPALNVEAIDGYAPKKPSTNSATNGNTNGTSNGATNGVAGLGESHSNDEAAWTTLFRRATAFDDDGHLPKTIRALRNGADLVREYGGNGQDTKTFPMTPARFLQAAHMTIDGVEAGEPHWIRTAGLADAWDGVPALMKGNRYYL